MTSIGNTEWSGQTEFQNMILDGSDFGTAKSTWSKVADGARKAAHYMRPTVWHNNTVYIMGKANALESWYAKKPAQVGINFVAMTTGLIQSAKAAVKFVVMAPVAITALIARVIVAAIRLFAPEAEALKAADKSLAKVVRKEVKTAGSCVKHLAGAGLSLNAVIGETFFIGGSKMNFELQQKLGNVSMKLMDPKAVAEEAEVTKEVKIQSETFFGKLKAKELKPLIEVTISKRAAARHAKKAAKKEAELAKKAEEKTPVEQPKDVVVGFQTDLVGAIRSAARSAQESAEAAVKAKLASNALKHAEKADEAVVELRKYVKSADEIAPERSEMAKQKLAEAEKYAQIANAAVDSKETRDKTILGTATALALGAVAWFTRRS